MLIFTLQLDCGGCALFEKGKGIWKLGALAKAASLKVTR